MTAASSDDGGERAEAQSGAGCDSRMQGTDKPSAGNVLIDG
jgi:hypothetical protein